MVKLSVNLNKVATLRNARGGVVPSVTAAAATVLDAGAHGITVHPRPDGRHIRRHDVFELASLLADRPAVELNVEGYPSVDFLELVAAIRPAQATLVPDPPEVLTSNAGWPLQQMSSNEQLQLAGVITDLNAQGIRTSLFLKPEPADVELARKLGANRIELYTEAYARAFPTARREEVFGRYRSAAEHAVELGLGVNAGHDLDRDNLGFFAAGIPGLLEVSIGHALIADALWLGLEATVKAYLNALRPAGEPARQ